MKEIPVATVISYVVVAITTIIQLYIAVQYAKLKTELIKEIDDRIAKAIRDYAESQKNALEYRDKWIQREIDFIKNRA